jgi:hypothetical protein
MTLTITELNMKTLIALGLAASLSGCAAFCDSNDYGCIAKQHAIAAQVAAVGVATLGAAAAYQASRPVYYTPPVVYVCRWPYC